MTSERRRQAQGPVLAPGQVLAGRYRVDRVLGEGGMGMVVAAVHVQLKTRVALKVLKRSAIMFADAEARFIREARAAANLKSEHVAHVTDFGTIEDGSPFLVMEYLEGKDLSELLDRHGAFHVQTAVDYVLQTCEALAKAHVLGIVHRDIKPANLFLTRGDDGLPCIKVLDFGISKVAPDGALGTQTQQIETGIACGSPQYMAPEQIRAALDMDGQTDIWALGVTLFELLTKRAPFTGMSIQQLSVAILEQPAPSIRTIRPDVPPVLDEAIQRSLAKDRAQRWPNIAQFASALAPFGSKRAQTSMERIAVTMPNAFDALSYASTAQGPAMNRAGPAPPQAVNSATALQPTVPQGQAHNVRGQTAHGQPTLGSGMSATAPTVRDAMRPMSHAPVQATIELPTALMTPVPRASPGQPMQPAPQLSPVLPASPARSSQLPLFIALGVMAFFMVVLGIGGILYVRSSDKPEPTASTMAMPSAPVPAASIAAAAPSESVAAPPSKPAIRIEVPERLLVNRPIRFSIGTTARLYVALLTVDETGAGALLLPNKRNGLPVASSDAALYFPSPDEERAGLTPVASLPPGKSSTKEKFICLGFADEVRYKSWVDGTRRAGAILNPKQVVQFVEGAERDGAVVQERAYEIVR